MKMKKACEATFLTERAIRLYISRGLITPQQVNGLIDFSPEDVTLLRDIALLRQMDFSVEQIAGMISGKEIPAILAARREAALSGAERESAVAAALSGLEETALTDVHALADGIRARRVSPVLNFVQLDEMDEDVRRQEAAEASQAVDRQQKRQRLNERWAVIDKLYRSVSGQLSQKVKISFETYVQQYYFRQVIAAANKRLTLLTGGMFTLRCKEEAKNMRSQAGLDLDVLDRSTGLWRDVSTLSGGESFMASLALALGLSDVVQERSGGVRLEAMFIDEGFGTLDETALRQAMELLGRLADGKRLIGVISHVPEMKERIERRIVVKKRLTGSELTVEG